MIGARATRSNPVEPADLGRRQARRILLGLAHKAAKLAGLDDDGRRAVQQEATGKASCASMTDTELRRLLWHYKGRGVDIGVPHPPPRGGSDGARPTGAQWAEIERLAHEIGWEAGLDDRRLAAFVLRTAKVDAVPFLRRAQAGDIISGLRRWLKQRQSGQDAPGSGSGAGPGSGSGAGPGSGYGTRRDPRDGTTTRGEP